MVTLWDVENAAKKRAIATPSGGLTSVAFSPGGRFLAAGASAIGGNALTLFDPASGALLGSQPGPGGNIQCIAFSPDGNALCAVADSDTEIILWDLQPSREMRNLPVENATGLFALPDPKTLAVCFDGRIELRDVETGMLMQTIPNPGSFSTEIAFTSKGHRLAFVANENRISIWDIPGKKEIATVVGHHAAFTPEGEILAAGWNQEIRLHKVGSPNAARLLKAGKAHINCLVFTPDGQTLVTGWSDSLLRIWDVKDAKLRHSVQAQEGGIWRLGLSPDGARIVSTGGSSDTKARIWETATGKLLQTLEGHTKRVRGAGFSADGRKVITAGEDGTLRAWDAATGKELARLPHRHDYLHFAWLPDGKHFATADNKTLRVWSLAAFGKPPTSRTDLVKNYPPIGKLTPVALLPLRKKHLIEDFLPATIAFSNNGTRLILRDGDGCVKLLDSATLKQLASIRPRIPAILDVGLAQDGDLCAFASQENTIHLWSLATQAEKQVLKGHSDFLRCVAVSPNATLVVAGSGAGSRKSSFGQLLLWDLTNGKRELLAKNEGYERLAFSPDGSLLAVGTLSNKIRLWDVKARTELWAADVPQRPSVLAFSLDGKVLAVAGNEDLPGKFDITTWDTKTGQHLATLEGHHGGVRFLSFVPGGPLLSAEGGLAGLKVWDPATGKLLHELDDFRLPAAVSPTGDSLVSRGQEPSILLFHELRALLDDQMQNALVPIARAKGKVELLDRAYHIELAVEGIESGAAFAGLKNLGKPHTLDLSSSHGVVDDNLALLAGDRQLKALNLKGQSLLTGAGFKHLASLSGLERLTLSDTEFADTDLAHLHGLPKLQSLTIKGTKVTDGGIARLKKANPKVSVVR
jgi:WD40 repeat protein